MKNGRVLFTIFCVFALFIFSTVALAPDAYAEGNDVIIVETDGARITISDSNKVLNLNGKNNVIVEFASNVELSVVDTAFMGANGAIDFTGNSAGALTVKGEGKIAPVTLYNGYRYLAVNENGTYSFHPFNLTVSKIGISTYADTVTIRATFIANDVVKALVKDYGLTNLTAGMSASAKASYGFGDSHGFHAYFDLEGSLNEGNLSEEKDFCAYITLGGQNVSSAQSVHIVPKTVLEWVGEAYDGYSAIVQNKFLNLIKRNIHLTEIPTIAQIMNRAVLATDKAKVDEMNKYLSAFIAGRPEDFGSIKMRLYEYGWSREDDFIPLSKGYSFRWYAEENMVLLVDGNSCVVYPEEYVGFDDTDNIRKCFDISLPAARVTKENTPASVIDAVSSTTAETTVYQDLVAKYTFETADSETKYNDWYGDYYISFSNVNGDEIDYSILNAIKLAGYYDGWRYSGVGDDRTTEDEEWLIMPLNEYMMELLTSNGEMGVFDMLTGSSVPYDYFQYLTDIFKCGVVADEDTLAGISMNVELRVVNPEDPEQQVVLAYVRHEFGTTERTDIADKSLVRFWNAYFVPSLEETPGDFGTFKEKLLNFGFPEETLVPKTEGYKFCWYAEENVIVLVDEQNQVIYPNTYKGMDAGDVRMFFDLSLPVATIDPVPQFTVTKYINPSPVKVRDYYSVGIDEASIIVRYDITASAEYSEYYNDWIVDVYLSCELPEDVDQVDIGLVGAYEGYDYWYPAVLRNFREGQTLALWGDFYERAPTLSEFQRNIKTLSGAIVDPKVHSEHFEQMFGDTYDDSTGATLNAELRLTNPDDSTDYVVVSISRYTF